ncbi:MAG: MipA/OmpV family protein [Tabrizicola sp.]
MLNCTIRSRSGLATIFALALLGACCRPDVAAAEGLKYSLGLYGVAAASPFESDKVKGLAAPDFRIEGESFAFGTNGLTYHLIESGVLTLSARLAPRFVMADPANVAGLDHLKRDIAVEAGFAASLSLGQVQMSVEALKDVSDTHDGAAVAATFGTTFEVSDRFSIGAQAGATWMDRKLATYTYGVLPNEARAGLAAYSVNEALIPTIAINANYAVNDHTSLVGGLTADFLPDSVTSSPIVKRDYVVSVMLGLRHDF